jgi:FkbM family methyltransferase
MAGRFEVSLKSAIRATVPRSLRNWLRSPSKSLEWLSDYVRFYFGSTKVLRLSAEWSVICHPGAYHVAHEAQVADPEQSEEFRSFISSCHSGMLLFDIGAHFGMFSLAAAHFQGRAVAVDPSPTAIRMIAIQARLNNCSSRIHSVLAAVSESNGVIRLLSSGVFSHGYLRVVGGRPVRELTPVPALTIDHMVRHYGTPTHLKIDVEGHEAAVLRGGRATLAHSSPLIFIELHNQMVGLDGGDPNAALDELAALGYSTYALNGEPIERRAILQKAIIRVAARRATGSFSSRPLGEQRVG